MIEVFKKNLPKSKAELKQQIQQIFKKALNAAELNRDLESIILHCKLLALDPKHLMGLRNLSLLLKRSGQYKDALHFIDQCIRIRPIAQTPKYSRDNSSRPWTKQRCDSSIQRISSDQPSELKCVQQSCQSISSKSQDRSGFYLFQPGCLSRVCKTNTFARPPNSSEESLRP